MIVIARYTRRGDYERYAKQLAESCKRFDLPADIRPVEDAGSWAATCNDRPQWILQALTSLRQPVLAVDVDCEFRRFPALFAGLPCDFAAYNWSADQLCAAEGKHAYEPHKLIISGGVTYWNYTAPAFELLLRWIYRVQEEPAGTKETDPLLDEVFNATQNPYLRAMWLPREYNFLSPRWGDGDNAVILHHYVAGAIREMAPAEAVACA